MCFAPHVSHLLQHSVALGRTWLLATSGFTQLHKAPHFQKCPSSKTSITIFQTCFNFKNKFYPKLLLLENAGPHECPTQSKTLYCDSSLCLVTSTERGGGGACVWGLGGAWSGAWAVNLDWAWLGTLVLALACLSEASWSRDFPILPSESFGGAARACGHEIFQPSRQKVSRGFVPEVC